MKKLIKKTIKNILHRVISGNKDYSNLQVLSGPAKGVRLRLDIRKEGSYFWGNYDKWIFDRVPFGDYVRPGMVIWDCGAYVGYYTAVFRKCLGKTGSVYTFEASSRNFNTLKEIPGLNGWENVHILNLALGPDHTMIKFANNLGGANGPVGLSKGYSETLEIEEVKCCGVDELVYEMDIPAPDFIKFDLETAEEFALHNGKQVFSGKRPVVLLELHGRGALVAAGSFLEKYQYKAALVWDMPAPKVYYKNLQDIECLTFVPHMILCTPIQ